MKEAQTKSKFPSMPSEVKIVTEKQILDAFEGYIKQLVDNPKMTSEKFSSMQTAVVGCMYLVNDLFGSPRRRYEAKVK